jgi:hypothetical protein
MHEIPITPLFNKSSNIYYRRIFWLYFRHFCYVPDKLKINASTERQLTKQVNCSISYS